MAGRRDQDGREGGSARGQMQESTAGTFHHGPMALCRRVAVPLLSGYLMTRCGETGDGRS